VLGIDSGLKRINPGFDWSSKAGESIVTLNEPGLVKTLRALPPESLPSAISLEGDTFKLNMGARVKDLNEAFSSMINANQASKLGLEPGQLVKFFHESPLTAYSIRSQAAHALAIQSETTLRLADRGLVHIVTTDAGKAAALADGMLEVRGWHTPIGSVFAPKEIASDMERVMAVTRNAQELKSFKKLADQTTAMWTRQVLSPITKGLAYPLRNAITNTINSIFGGLTVSGQAEANRIQMKVMRGASKLMGAEGLNFDAALAKTVEGIDDGGRTATLVKYLRDDNIMNTGLYRSLDMMASAGDIERAGKSGLKGFASKRLSPLSPQNVLFAPGKAVNVVIEDNARIALYVSVFDSTGSREAAREAVAKYLFDYNDLTPFESHVLKTANAFWTFTRKNTALQLKLLADRPQLLENTMRIKQRLFDPNGDNNLLYPGEAAQGKGVAGGLLRTIGGGTGAANIDDPITAAMQALDPVIMTAYAGIEKLPGGKSFVGNLPPSEKPTLQNITRGVLRNTAGAPAAVATFLFENASGTTIEGRPVKEDPAWQKLVNTIAPVDPEGQFHVGHRRRRRYQDADQHSAPAHGHHVLPPRRPEG
jgi:hypothetical protein